jgi:hypothetical protein
MWIEKKTTATFSGIGQQCESGSVLFFNELIFDKSVAPH